MSFLLLPISNVVLFRFALGRDSASLQVVCFDPGRSLRLSVPERSLGLSAGLAGVLFSEAPIFAPAYQVLISVLFPGPLSLLHPSHSSQLSPTQDPFCLFCTSLRACFHSQLPSLCLQAWLDRRGCFCTMERPFIPPSPWCQHSSKHDTPP